MRLKSQWGFKGILLQFLSESMLIQINATGSIAPPSVLPEADKKHHCPRPLDTGSSTTENNVTKADN